MKLWVLGASPVRFCSPHGTDGANLSPRVGAGGVVPGVSRREGVRRKPDAADSVTSWESVPIFTIRA